MSSEIHKRFVEIAQEISGQLADAVLENGPVRIRKRNEAPLADTLCRAVAGQQLSTKVARSIWSRVLEAAGDALLVDHVATVTTASLRGCGLSNAKAKAMKAIVEAAEGGRLDVQMLSELGHVDRSKQLTTIWGVGQWTADMISIFYFGDEDVWPDTDVTVWKTLERLTSKRRKTANTAKLFSPHRTYLALHMYQFADGGKPMSKQ